MHPKHSILSIFLFSLLRNAMAELSFATLGRFNIMWDQEEPMLQVSNHEDDRILFRTLQNWPFLTVGFASSSSEPIESGNYKINEWILYETPYQSIKSVVILPDSITMRGEMWGLVTVVHYNFTLSIKPETPSLLAFNVTTATSIGTFNRIFLNYWCDSDEKIFGLGVQYSFFNMKGRRVPIVVAEQGIGRGAEPLTSLLNLIGDGSGGYWHTTYAPKPLYITSMNRSLLLTNDEISIFDFRDDDAIVIEVWGGSIHGYILHGDSYFGLVETITSLTGRMRPLPKWTQAGAIIGLEGGTAEATEHTDTLLAANVSVSGVWLQDWVGIRSAFDGDRLVWNWQLHSEYYPAWDAMVTRWREQGIRTLSYINPFFSNPEGFVKNISRNLFVEGIENGYFIQSKHGKAYLLRSGSIESHMIDLTNPSARVWLKDVIKNHMIRETKVSGWMADFGEYVPCDAVLFDASVDPMQYHNVYPQEWARLNEEAVAEYEAEFAGSATDPLWKKTLSTLQSFPRGKGGEVMYFMRSAWLRSPGFSRAFWIGDQMVGWDGFDGIKTVLIAYLSGGIGGHSLTHSDIGGYTVEDKGMFPYVRSQELLMRWTELEAFGSVLFRTHIGSATQPNAQIYDDACTLSHFSIFTNIFARLAKYRRVLMAEAAESGWPLIRPMFAQFGYDAATWTLQEQFLFGPDFLVAPVLDPSGSKATGNFTNETICIHSEDQDGPCLLSCPEPYFINIRVYLPAWSSWTFLWTGEQVSTEGTGRYVIVRSPVGNPPVFFRPESSHGKTLYNYILAKRLDRLYGNARRVLETDECDPAMEARAGMTFPSWVKWLGVTEVNDSR